MAKKIPDSLLDQMLSQIEGTVIHICEGEPTDFADITNVELASKTIDVSYIKSAGVPTGRRNQLQPIGNIPISKSGTANHVAISNGTSILYCVTTCTPQALTSGGTVDTNAFSHDLNAPA